MVSYGSIIIHFEAVKEMFITTGSLTLSTALINYLHFIRNFIKNG